MQVPRYKVTRGKERKLSGIHWSTWGVKKEKRSRMVLLRQMSRIRSTARKTNEEAEKEINEQ